MTRVIHTGDTHIGYAQYHSSVRRQDFLDAFAAVVDDAIDDGVDAVVHAGDLFHDRRPALSDLMGTIRVLRRLADADIPFLAVVGNHEAARGGQWLDLFERLDLATRLGDEPITVDDTAFYGLDHVPVSRRDTLTYDFSSHDASYATLVAHGLFEPFAHADWDTKTVLEESDVAFDAVLLGDNHTPGRAEVADTWVTYPGSTERASASEREGRGYNLVRFDETAAAGDDRVEIRRRALETRPFVFVEVDLDAREGEPAVRERVRQHDVTDAVVLVEVTGDGDPITPAAVEAFATDRGALIARVSDRRTVETDESVDVHFADPESAVRERVESMGLSAAALDVDDAVRSTGVADSNVRETVKTRVTDRLDDPGAFVTAGDTTPAEHGGDSVGDEGDASDDDEGSNTNDESGNGSDTVDTDGGSDDRSDTVDESDDEHNANDTDGSTETTPTDGQVSMEDYL